MDNVDCGSVADPEGYRVLQLKGGAEETSIPKTLIGAADRKLFMRFVKNVRQTEERFEEFVTDLLETQWDPVLVNET